jgi:hypothetical protein
VSSPGGCPEALRRYRPGIAAILKPTSELRVSVAHDPVPDAPAILVDDVLAVADLHIGIEAELQESGVTLPSQTRKIATRLRDLGGSSSWET